MDTTLKKIASVDTIEKAKALLYTKIEPTQAIKAAFSLGQKAHEGQFRKSGEPYYIHPILVAYIVASITQEPSMVIAGLLHDVVEDTDVTLKSIEELFGSDVAHLVDGLTKIVEMRDEKLIDSSSSTPLTKSALTFRKILLSSTKDIRVLIVKLCDRLHNMLTLDALPKAKQKRIAEETMVVYAPIAHRLGVSSIKRELEDLSFKYLFPEAYVKIEHYLNQHHHDFMELLNSFIDRLKLLMMQEGFEEHRFKIFGRVKHYYSTYLKMQRKGIGIEEVLDLLAVRVLVDHAIDCYKVIGIIHLHFRPLMARFKDYVSIPKENGYQTIHTTIFDNRSIFEVQVRTFEMHQTAELGVAAHWKYKSGGNTINLEWLNHLSDQSDNVDDFIDLAQKDLFSEDITVYSPNGDIFTLPRGAVALDFAYAVHTDVGNRAKHALINKVKEPLLKELKNGDMIRIVLDEEVAVRCTWLDAVKTSKARQALLHHCHIKSKEIANKVALNIMTAILNIKPKKFQAWLERCEHKKRFYKAASDPSFVTMLANAYQSYMHKESRLSRMLPMRKIKLKEYRIGNLIFFSPSSISETAFSHCCHPKQGDDILAFKEGSQAEVHHEFCETALKEIDKGRAMVLVRWSSERAYKYHLTVSLVNSKGALAKFLQYLAKMGIDILAIELGNKKDNEVQHCIMSFETKESNIQRLHAKIEQKAHIVEFVRADDIYQK